MDEVISWLSIICSGEHSEQYNEASFHADRWLRQIENILPSIEILQNDSIDENIKLLLLLHFIPNINNVYDKIIEQEGMFQAILEQFMQILSTTTFQENEKSCNLILQIISFITLNNVQLFSAVYEALNDTQHITFAYYFMEQMNDNKLNHKKVEVCNFMAENASLFIGFLESFMENPNHFLKYCSFLVWAPKGTTSLEFLNPFIENIILSLLDLTCTSSAFEFLDSLCSPITDSVDMVFLTTILEGLIPALGGLISNSDYNNHILTIWDAILSFDQVDEMHESSPELVDSLITSFFEQIPAISIPENFSSFLQRFSSFFCNTYSIDGLEQYGDTFLELCLGYINTGSEDSISIEMQETIRDLLDERSDNQGEESTEEILGNLTDEPAQFLFVSAVSGVCIEESCDLILSSEEIPHTAFLFLGRCYNKINTKIDEILQFVLANFASNPIICSKVINAFSKNETEIIASHFQEIYQLISQSNDFYSFSNIIYSLIYLLNQTSDNIDEILQDLLQQLLSISLDQLNYMKLINSLLGDIQPQNERIFVFYQSLYTAIAEKFVEYFQSLHNHEQNPDEDLNDDLDQEFCTFFSLSVQLQYCNDPNLPLEYTFFLLTSKKCTGFLLNKIYTFLRLLPQSILTDTFISYFTSIDMEEKPEECMDLLELIEYIVRNTSINENLFHYFPFDFIMNFFNSRNLGIQNKLLDLIVCIIPFINQEQRAVILTTIVHLLQTNYKKMQADFSCNVFLQMCKYESRDFIAAIFSQGGESELTAEICSLFTTMEKIDTNYLKRLFQKYNASFSSKSIRLH